MIVIAILAIPFIFYFVQRPDYGAIGRDQFARIYDRNVSMLEAQQFARLLNLAQALGMSDFVGTMTAGAGLNQNQARSNSSLTCLSCGTSGTAGTAPQCFGGCRCCAKAAGFPRRFRLRHQ